MITLYFQTEIDKVRGVKVRIMSAGGVIGEGKLKRNFKDAFLSAADKVLEKYPKANLWIDMFTSFL